MSREEKQEPVDRKIVLHLGFMRQGSNKNERFEEDSTFNKDETCYCISVDDGRKLAMKEDPEVKYREVASGNKGKTMMVMFGGNTKPQFEIPVNISKKTRYSCSTQNMPDNVSIVCNRKRPNVSINTLVFEE